MPATTMWRATVPPPPPGSSEADDRIRRALLARVEREPWWRPGTTKLAVQKGKVVYQGLTADAGIRRVARRIAEAIPGVCSVWHARAPSAQHEPHAAR